MKSRERRYLKEKWLLKMINRISEVNDKLDYDNLLFYGMMGAEHILLPNGNIRQRHLTIDECFDLKDKIEFTPITPESYDGEIYNKFHDDEFRKWGTGDNSLKI